jgi:hypothetical protein
MIVVYVVRTVAWRRRGGGAGAIILNKFLILKANKIEQI